VRSKTMLAAAVAVGWGALWGHSALADDVRGEAVTVGGDKPVVEKLLDIMLNSGQISPSQYDELLEQSREEQVSAAAAVAEAVDEAPPVSEGPADWTVKWSNGFKVERNDGAFQLKFGGRIMGDTAFVWLNDGLAADLAALGIDPKDGSGAEFRRARIFFEGSVYERAFFKAQYDFANTGDGETDFKDVYLGLKKLGPVRDVRVGHFKEPFMLDEWTSSKYITFMERGLNSVFFPGRNMGIMAQGNQLDEKLLWQVGLFYNTNDQGFAFDEWGEGQLDLAARLAGAALYADDGAKVVHLGVDYIHQFRDGAPDSLRYRQRPGSHLAQYWADTESFAANDSDVLNLELAGVCGPFSAQAEFTGSWVQGSKGLRDSQLWGLYVFASYFLTGEQRAYDLGNGRFGRVKPKSNFNPARGDWGAWEIAARYSTLDLNDRDLTGGRLWNLTAGINWYLYPNLRLMINYVYADVADRVSTNPAAPPATLGVNGAGNIFQMRAQIDF
jgi:phosphate-selective porin OprO/OprP